MNFNDPRRKSPGDASSSDVTTDPCCTASAYTGCSESDDTSERSAINILLIPIIIYFIIYFETNRVS